MNLNDPDSIVRWHAIHPQRHAAFLKAARRLWPEFRPAIDEAIRIIKSRAGESALGEELGGRVRSALP